MKKVQLRETKKEKCIDLLYFNRKIEKREKVYLSPFIENQLYLT